MKGNLCIRRKQGPRVRNVIATNPEPRFRDLIGPQSRHSLKAIDFISMQKWGHRLKESRAFAQLSSNSSIECLTSELLGTVRYQPTGTLKV